MVGHLSEPQHLGSLDRTPSAVADFSDTERFRVYDPTTGSIVSWGQHFDLQPIATEVGRIFPIAEQEAVKPHWVVP